MPLEFSPHRHHGIKAFWESLRYGNAPRVEIPSGAALLITNGLRESDAFHLELALGRKIVFLAKSPTPHQWKGLEFLTNPHQAKEFALAHLQRGETVCLPAGGIIGAQDHALHPDLEWILSRVTTPIIPLWVDSKWDEIFHPVCPSFLPFVRWWRRRRIRTGIPLTGTETSVESLRHALYQLSEQALRSREELQEHLGSALIHGLKTHATHPVLIDGFLENKTLNGYRLLAAGLLLADWLRKSVPDRRIALVLPTGTAANVANLACILAHKIPVNLNFTAGRLSNEIALQKAGIRVALTIPEMVSKLDDFPWPATRLDLKELLKTFTPIHRLSAYLRARFLPSRILKKQLRLPETGDQTECALLFTSGSSGTPKAVVLSHRNILANIAQVQSVLGDLKILSMLGSLPVFHSFGFTVTLWWPMLRGPRVITYPSPLETHALLDLIQQHKIELVLSTPTFLRSFLKRGKFAQLQSVRMVVTGAERLPPELLQEFESKFAVPVCEGYGMTEASPVVSVNLTRFFAHQEGAWANGVVGGVGPLIPGMSFSIRDPETDALLPFSHTGMLWLQGSNLFPGYLHDPERTAAVLKDYGYRTGDLARLDEKGYLHIEGRLSRFSKIGGEMIPHGTLEQAITQALQLNEEQAAGIAICGIRDESKGEALVLVTSFPIEIDPLRKSLLAQGLPALWIPKIIRRVEAIPTLASGKLDLQKLQALANG